MEKERDYQKDLEICEKATPGPWEVVPIDVEFKDDDVIQTVRIYLPVKSVTISELKTNTYFVALSKKALPWYIRKVMELENRNAELEAENGRLREALDNIIRPIHYMQKEAEAEGKELSRHFAVQLSSDIGYLKRIAKQALSQGAGDRYKKMQAVVDAAKDFEHDLISSRTIPDTNLWIKLRRTLADLEGGASGD